MTVSIAENNIYYEGRHIYAAPAAITESVILDDGIVIVYDVSKIAERFDALKNVVKIDLSGKELWQIKAGAESGPVNGYRHLHQTLDKKRWIITYGSGRYDYYLDMQTGQTHLVKD